MASRITKTFIDYTNERSNFQVAVTTLTAGNLVAQQALIDTLHTAMEAITLGTPYKREVFLSQTVGTATPASDVNAQRERKWLVRYQDNVNYKVGSCEIPTADISGTHLLPNKDDADLTDTDIAAFVAAFEAVARTVDGNNLTVLGLVHVGRKG